MAQILAIALLFCSCSTGDQERIRKRNCKAEYIYRKQSDRLCVLATPKHTPRVSYSWEESLSRITKDYFRCKGNSSNPAVLDGESTPHLDCTGSAGHGLPLVHGQQSVYPILIDLLNYVQKCTGQHVVITSGHRCPTHNTYVDLSKENIYSKHQIGAEVDFYVQGMENRPDELVQILMDFYKNTPPYKGKKEFEDFQRYEKPDAHVLTKPWFNKEIYIKQQTSKEGRNGDNRHPYPFITLQVRYDRDTQERVVYDWKKANFSQ